MDPRVARAVAAAAPSLVELDGSSCVLDDGELLVGEGVGVGVVTASLSSTSSGASKSSIPSLARVHPSALPSLLTAFPRTNPSSCASNKSIVVSKPVLRAAVTFVHVGESLALAVQTTQFSTSVAPFQEIHVVLES